MGEEIRTFDKKSPLGEEDFKGSEDAACLRKLWTLSCKVGKAEVESLAGIESVSKPKVSGPVANELEEQAVSGRRIPRSTRFGVVTEFLKKSSGMCQKEWDPWTLV